MTSRVAVSTVAVMDERLGIASRILRWWRSLPMLVVDGALAVVVLAVSLIEVGANNRSGEIGPWRTALLVAMSLVIVFRRRYPIAVWLVSGRAGHDLRRRRVPRSDAAVRAADRRLHRRRPHQRRGLPRGRA